ncbi:MAG: SpoIIE family protein phosphatase [Planctomycetes bacterium]|nr:SpoIIE family protein phosphatase [Planctomycetota bacterium]
MTGGKDVMTPAPSTDQLRLEPVAGTDAPSLSVRDQAEILVGRAQECDLCLADAVVSRRHASVARRKHEWVLTDLGSRHGTYLNGVLLRPGTPTLIASGDFVRFGPYTFRVNGGGGSGNDSRTLAAVDEHVAPGTIVERISNRELEALAQRRLELLIEGASILHQTSTETELAAAVVGLVLAGSGFRRAAVLRPTGSGDQVEVLAARDLNMDRPADFSFSRSLLREAASGHVARLSRSTDALLGQSIQQLGILCAVCAPITLDSSVVSYIYLDSREAEQPGYDDAAGFCRAVSRIAGLALANIKRTELQRRHERLDQDLNAARQAQAFLWPSEEGVVGALKYAMRMTPGRIVAGDLFDIFPLDDHRVGLCFGDVSGQGMGAAILMTAVLSYLRAAMARLTDPAEAANAVNRYTTERSPANMFVSLWIGVFDDRDQVLHFVDAGHGHWIIKPHGEPPATAPRPQGILVGIDPDFRYVAQSLKLAPGDRFILYSDGVVEHRAPSGEDFGVDRLLSAIAESTTPSEDVSHALASLQEYLGNLVLADDTTLASMEVQPAPQRPTD